MFTIENHKLQITIAEKGAELQSIFHKKLQMEYMWNGDPSYWAKRSPVLFPIVGTLKNDSYEYGNHSFKLSRHGFAREMVFDIEKQLPDAIFFLLKSSPATLKNFPFEFEFRIGYGLQENILSTTYRIKNKTPGGMYFSVGGHPAFKVPLVEGTSYDDYYLEFDRRENLSRWPISKNGLIEKKSVPLLEGEQRLFLSKQLFSNDALVFKHPASSIVSLRSDRTGHGLNFHISGFPYLGIWAARNADFVCIEPWCGIADSVDSDQQFIHKEGINKLAFDEIFDRTWSVECF